MYLISSNIFDVMTFKCVNTTIIDRYMFKCHTTHTRFAEIGKETKAENQEYKPDTFSPQFRNETKPRVFPTFYCPLVADKI